MRVDTYIEELSGERKQINRAYLILVALDENERPVEVPRLRLSSYEEKVEFESLRKSYKGGQRRCPIWQKFRL